MYLKEQLVNKVLQGNIIEVLQNIPGDFYDCILTSPPYYCYDEKTEILTIDGWKLIKDVSLGTQVLTLNILTNILEYQSVEEKIETCYKGPMLHFKTKNIDLLVTPNHKIFVEGYRSKCVGGPNNRWISNKHLPLNHFREASKAKYNDKIPLLGFNWNGEEKEYFELPMVTIEWVAGSSYNSHRKIIRMPIKIKMDDWLAFFGFWIAEGYTRGSKGGNDRGGEVCVKQKTYQEYLINILEKLPFKWSQYGEVFTIFNRQLWTYLKQFGNSHTKFIPKELKALSKRQLNILFESYMKGDGDVSGRSAFSVSHKLVEDLSEIAVKLGKNSKICGNLILFKRTQRFGKLRQSKVVEYEGKVYCVTVPNHIVYVRRNYTPVFNGNSMRNYGSENNVIWNAKEDCDHKWVEYTRPGNTWSVPGPGLYAGKMEYNKAWVKPQIQKVCSECGAIFCQLGLEPTPALFIAHMTDICRELRRVLKPTGLFFLNVGDTFAGSKSGYGEKLPNPKSKQSLFTGQHASSVMRPPADTCVGSESWIRPKQLLMIPARLAISLQSDGWLLRKDIIWSKTSCLPTSVKDNFNSTHEHIFMFAKEGKYFFDQSKARRPYAKSTIMRYNYKQSSFGGPDMCKSTGPEKALVMPSFINLNPLGGVKGDVWEMNVSQYKGKHWATFSEELVENCLGPGCSKQVCTECGVPKMEVFKMTTRNFEELPDDEKKKWGKVQTMEYPDEIKAKLYEKILRKRVSLGVQPSCKCNSSFGPGIVLDPFSGAGTTLIMAKKLGLNYTGIELNSSYVRIAESRLSSML